MGPANRLPHSSAPIPVPIRPQAKEIHFIKAGHRYTYRCEEGGELTLICALLSAAIDPRLNLDLGDARKLIQLLGLAPHPPAKE